ncbi:MAG: single-stranded DNA-binding protein [Paraclostridium sp.]
MVNKLLDDAIDELQYLEPGEIVLVKDLFKGYVWGRIDRNIRLRLGILFLNHINSNPSLGVIALEKTSSNQQKYKKL